MIERAVHPVEYLRILARRRWWFVVPFALCVVGGIALALLLPPTFRSSARIGIQAPAVAPDLVAARAVLDNQERLRALSQQLRSPVVLQRVAREEGLASERPLEQVVQDLLEPGRISVELPVQIAHTQREPELNAFDIVYLDRTADRARRVANRLAQVFVEEHSRSREMQAEGTAEFLGAQLRGAQERISSLERRLRSAKELHMGQLPEQTLANLQTLAGVRQQLESTSNNLRSEQDRLSLIDRQMQSMKEGLYSAPAAATGIIASPQQRVVALQRELDHARSLYTDKHPEVQILEDQLKTARADAAAVRSQPDSARQETLSGDPAYQQVLAERNQTQLRLRGLQRAEVQLRGDIARYQRRVEATPMVEQELASTEREYAFEKENYKQLSERHAAALVQEQIARTRGGERFSLLNAAYLPHSPESPNRLRILLMALALGVAMGGALTFGREFLDRSIRDARKLQDEFDVPVLAEIPRIHDAA
jgi:polysaccharide chain length determinant protein (PEP-CTERM system associated)